MTRFKRIISAILLLAILIGMVPATVQATGTSAATENTGTSIEGTNGFGTLLSEEIQTKQEETEKAAESGYNVIGLEIENGVVTVSYSSLEEAILVVSLYTEDSVKMLLSGKTVVSPEETVATVQLEGDIPEYFMAAAYLLDTYDHSPLCTAYETPMYTKEMQQLLASTTDDYDADKILQLDDDNTTNFAVYTDSTIVLEYEEGVNTVVSANDETLTYVIENADSTVTGLLPGNIFAYAYGEDQILIVKVATVTVDGATATINGADVEMEEVFSHLKVEAAGDTANMTVDENSGDEDVTYVGMVEDRPAQRSGEGGSTSGGVSAGFEVEKKSGNKTLTASLLLNINLEFSYYIAKSRQFIEFKATTETILSVEVSGKISYPVIKLKTFGFSPIPSVYVGFEPTISFIFSAKVSANLKTTDTIGFSYDSTSKKDKTKDLSTPSKVDFTLDAEGTIFFGVDFAPKLKILDGWVLEASLSAEIGLELEAEMDGTAFGDFAVVGNGDAPESLHNCETCLKVDLSLKIEPAISLKFLKVISAGTKLTVLSWSLGEWYLSENHGWFKKGTCPNQSYRITVSVSDANSKRVAGSAVTAKKEGQSAEIAIGTTNSTGIVANYLPAGNYTFTAWVAGQPVYKAAKISAPSKVTINKEFIDNGPPTFSGSINPDSVTDYGPVIASGECGDKGNNVLWTLYNSGLLKIFGKGAMGDFHGNNQPWLEYRRLIKQVKIDEGVTAIGAYAFYYLNITSVIIGKDVITIGRNAFNDCSQLTGFLVDKNNPAYSTDEQGVLFDKNKTALLLAYANLTGEYSIPTSVTIIDEYAFSNCTQITSVIIPEGVTTIKEWAFDTCQSLTSVTIPNSVTTIESFAFAGCSNLASVSIGNGLINMGTYIFTGCENIKYKEYGNAKYLGNAKNPYFLLATVNSQDVTSTTIHKDTKIIGALAYYHCDKITHVTIPDGVTVVANHAFYFCTGLTGITIPNSVTTIGEAAFWCCESLETVTIGNGVTSIGDSAFARCENLTRVIVDVNNPAYCNNEQGMLFNKDKTKLVQVPGAISGELVIPDSVITIGFRAVDSCEKLTSVTIPNSVITIGYEAFGYCYNLTSVSIGNNVTTIDSFAFYFCSSLRSVDIPDSVVTLSNYAFSACDNMTIATIGIGVKKIGVHAFENPTDIYYRGSYTQWTSIDIDENNPGLQNATIHYNSKAATRSAAVSNGTETPVVVSEDTEILNVPDLYYIYDGIYETEITDTYTLKKATFSGLVPGEQYVLLSLVSVEADDVLAPENLLYIDQAAAAEDGTLIFAYAQRTDTEISYVMACGASNQNLEDAVITFPSMAAKEELQAVHPTVAYNGKTLIEDVDYVISGTVDYTKAGEYTCYIRGIYDYTGLVECVYKVIDATASVTTEENTVYYETAEEALQAYGAGGILELYKDVTADLSISQDSLLNLNGFDITGNVTVNSGAEFLVMDSQTDDYTIKDEKGYGKITGTVSGVQAQDGYMMITEDSGVSFHRVNLQLKAMSLRASDAGIYFKSDFAGDELVAENVKQFGVALSLQGIPTTDNLETDCKYSKFTEFQAGVQDEDTTSTLLKGVMKSGNAALVNFRNANMPIYGRAYILTNEGEYIFGAAACRTFKQQVEAIDTMWSKLSASQKTSLAEMYDEFTSVMKSWNLPNLKDYIK